ncbi:hypothetical protein [Yinghuangia soli]|uniref:Lipoprotein n=1 Tax=Yinghuangia soli TaxID=2908204 RepID=A0AA41Q379_9ACTN|nr:hypothetical protein [Yinghuangia soli]MCF2530718.1 hypothetical protein [Yinghuangia soli]
MRSRPQHSRRPLAGRATTVVAACLAAVVLGAAACRNDGGTGSAPDAAAGGTDVLQVLRAAKDATAAARTVSGKGVLGIGEGPADKRVDAAFAYGPSPALRSTEVAPAGANAGAELPLFEYLATESRLYMRVLDGGDMPGADQMSDDALSLWTSLPPSGVLDIPDGPDGLGIDPGDRPPLSAAPDAHLALLDPLTGLAVLAAAPDARRIGSEKIDGKDAVHYQGVFPASALASATAASLGLTESQFQRLATDFRDNRPTSIQVDIWLGPDRLPVRQDVASRYDPAADRTTPPATESTDTDPGSGSDPGSDPGSESGTGTGSLDPPAPLAFTVSITYSGWRKPVDVAEPPAEQLRNG